MGKRVNYEIASAEGDVGIVLFTNNSHPHIDPEQIFLKAVSNPALASVSQMVSDLLALRYPTNGGNHQAGNRVFTIDICPGDREYVLRAEIGKPFGDLQTAPPMIRKLPSDYDPAAISLMKGDTRHGIR